LHGRIHQHCCQLATLATTHPHQHPLIINEHRTWPGTQTGVPTRQMPSTTSTPSTIGSRLLKTQVGRILSVQGNTATCSAACCSSSLTCASSVVHHCLICLIPPG
jgi:hypothetical protein